MMWRKSDGPATSGLNLCALNGLFSSRWNGNKKVYVCQTESHGLGIFANVDIASGSPIVRISYCDILTADRAGKVLETLCADATDHLPPHYIAPFYLLYCLYTSQAIQDATRAEVSSDEQFIQFWQMYVLFCIANLDAPTIWPKDHMRYLDSTSLQVPLEAKMQNLERVSKSIASFAEQILGKKDTQQTTAGKANFANENMQFSATDSLFLQLAAADAVWRSRCLELPDHATEAALVPLIDMCNHSFNFNCRYECFTCSSSRSSNSDDQDGTYVVLLAERNISAGEELTISYGDKSPAEFLYTYGFIAEEAPMKTTFVEIVPDLGPLQLLLSVTDSKGTVTCPSLEGIAASVDDSEQIERFLHELISKRSQQVHSAKIALECDSQVLDQGSTHKNQANRLLELENQILKTCQNK